MGFKEQFQKEKRELSGVRRPYESVAFILFALLVLQQLFYLFRALIQFMDKSNTWFSTTNIIVGGNLQNFIPRIINIDNTSWFYVILGVLAFALFYYLVYLFVWNYCRKNGLAKWTWSLFVVFGPSILFVPPYIFFAIYVFRKYFARFLKRFVEEFKSFDPNEEFPEEEEAIYNESDYDKYIKDEPVEVEEEKIEEKE